MHILILPPLPARINSSKKIAWLFFNTETSNREFAETVGTFDHVDPSFDTSSLPVLLLLRFPAQTRGEHRLPLGFSEKQETHCP